MLDMGAAWLEDKRHKFVAMDVTYRRGLFHVVLRATIGRSRFEGREDGGNVLRTETRDYLVRSNDLVLNGSVTTPVDSDVIIEVRGNMGYFYEVAAPPGEALFRYSDDGKRTLRIHTNYLRAAPV